MIQDTAMSYTGEEPGRQLEVARPTFGVHLIVWFPKVDGEDILPVLKKIKSYGFDGVEINLKRLKYMNIKEIGQLLEDIGLQCVCSTGLLNETQRIDLDNLEFQRNGLTYLRKCVEAVAALKSDLLSGCLYAPSGFFTDSQRTSHKWRNVVRNLRYIAHFAKQYRVKIGVEVLNRYETYFLNTAMEAKKLVYDIGENNVKVHLDTFHMNIEERNFYDPIVSLGNELGHFHCAENDRGSIIGKGNIDWDFVFKALKKIDYTDWLVIESFPMPKKGLSPQVRVHREFTSDPDVFAQESLAFLKEKWAAICEE